MPQSPLLLPRAKLPDRRVFLERKLWEELTEVAKFHQLVFEQMGSSEKVSRNDVIAAFLQWAVDSYWEDKGGRPTSKPERADKAKRHAEKLKTQGSKL